jgi:hypothetical protein
MAIEWYISDAQPVSQLEIIRMAGRVAARLLPGGIDLSVSIRAAERGVPSEVSSIFHSQLYGEGPGFTTLVEIDSQLSADDEGREADESAIFGAVSARRTLCSTVLGVSTAIAWLSVAGGELSGTGLKRYFKPVDVDELINSLRKSNNTSYEAAVMSTSHLLLGENAVLPFK